MERWYVVQTKPRAEGLALQEFQRDEYETYCPRVKNSGTSGSWGETPLFPGYFFLKCNPEGEGWPQFRPRHRVIGLVKFGDVAPSLSTGEVAKLKRLVEETTSASGLRSRFRPGTRVHIETGSISSLAEVVEQATSPQARVRVLLRFMGREISALVPPENLQVIQENEGLQIQDPRRTRGRGRWVSGFGPRGGVGRIERTGGSRNGRPAS